MICKHNKFEFYISVNVVIWELVEGIKNTWRGIITTIMPNMSLIFVCMHCDDVCSTVQ